MQTASLRPLPEQMHSRAFDFLHQQAAAIVTRLQPALTAQRCAVLCSWHSMSCVAAGSRSPRRRCSAGEAGEAERRPRWRTSARTADTSMTSARPLNHLTSPTAAPYALHPSAGTYFLALPRGRGLRRALPDAPFPLNLRLQLLTRPLPGHRFVVYNEPVPRGANQTATRKARKAEIQSGGCAPFTPPLQRAQSTFWLQSTAG